jgi:tRNA (cytidine/uridine-2'-O-)-methyltransferase
MDYRGNIDFIVHDDWQRCVETLRGHRLFALTTRGSARYDKVRFRVGDAFLFGPETRGLPTELLATLAPDARLRLPMVADSRSLNLANAVAVVVYEAWRQLDFANRG